MVSSIVLNTALLICTQFLDVDTFQCSGVRCELRKQNCVQQVANCLKNDTIQQCLAKQLEG